MMKGTIVCLVEVEIKIIVDASSHLEIAYEQIKVVEADVVKNALLFAPESFTVLYSELQLQLPSPVTVTVF